MSSGEIVKLNIGGTVFQTTKSTLTKFDGFFRTIMETNVPLIKDDSGCIFVDRCPKHFEKILNFMRDGHVALPNLEEDRQEMLKEAHYYLLDGLRKLFEQEKPVVNQDKNHFLESIEQIANAVVKSTKKAVIVITYNPKKIVDGGLEIASLIDKYDTEFDVYFFESVSCSVPMDFWHVSISVKSTGKVHWTNVCFLDSIIKTVFSLDG